jgi:CRP-like cAMP-binding protein
LIEVEDFMQRLKKSKKNELLKRVPLFSNLKHRSLVKIAKYADEVTGKAGQTLTRQGRRGYDFCFIVDGKAKVEKDGKIINHLSAYDFFGEISLLDNFNRTATVTAVTDVRLLIIRSRYFSSLLDEVPGLQREIISALCKYLRRELGDII